jgi:hypothetical protein
VSGPAEAVGLWAVIDDYRDVLADAGVAELAGGGSGEHHLRAVALESMLVDRLQARITVGVHHALMAGASLSEVAETVGLEPGQVAMRWMVWARGQRQLRACSGLLGLGEDDYARVAAVIDAGGVGGAGRRAPVRQTDK